MRPGKSTRHETKGHDDSHLRASRPYDSQTLTRFELSGVRRAVLDRIRAKCDAKHTDFLSQYELTRVGDKPRQTV